MTLGRIERVEFFAEGIRFRLQNIYDFRRRFACSRSFNKPRLNVATIRPDASKIGTPTPAISEMKPVS